MKLTKEQLIMKLKALHDLEPEEAHGESDKLLLEFIDDPDITKAIQELIESQPWWACA